MGPKYKCQPCIGELILLEGSVDDLFFILETYDFFLKDVLRPLVVVNIRSHNIN